MKPIIYILFLFLILFQSCENVLERKPLDTLSGDETWNNEVLLRGYLSNLYSRIYFYNFDESNMGDQLWLQSNTWFTWSDIASRDGNGGIIPMGNVTKANEGASYWDYVYIRDCNLFLEKIKTSLVPESVKIQLSGEVRFMRAFAYFEMMKRYGGVPLVDVVIDPFQPVDDKYTKRATEEAIADFIDSELTTASSLLTDDPIPLGKINKWTAYALQARAMLWAASIARYGIVELDGLVGIPASKAASYFLKASAAASEVIGSENYTLYNGIPGDKSENYRNIFLDEGNSEVIFEEAFDGYNKAHSFDAFCAPTEFATRGALCSPILEFLLGYENIDGSADQPILDKDHLYADGREPFIKKDPRLFGTVFFQGDAWSIGTIESYDGLDPSPTPDPTKIISNQNINYNGIRSVGYQSAVPVSGVNTNTGFTLKKYIDEVYSLPEFKSKTNWIAFRLAEMYLIKAEAEFEMGNIAPAVTALNKTRERAGISLVDDATISLDKIRNERKYELAFEGHRYWDLRRWRIAESVLNNKQFQGLHITLHYATGKYYFRPFNCETFTRVFKQEHYYNPITTSRINNNPKLIENPLY